MTTTYDIQMDVTGSDFESNPEPYLLADGQPVRMEGEKVVWDGKDWNGTNNGCSTCDVPHEGEITSFDWNDPDATYYFHSEKRNQCCGSRWVSAGNLTRATPLVPPTPTIERALALRAGVQNQTLTYHEITTGIETLTRNLLDEAQTTNTVARGVCSACFTDVQFVGGQWNHDDSRECSTPAVLLSH